MCSGEKQPWAEGYPQEEEEEEEEREADGEADGGDDGETEILQSDNNQSACESSAR